MIKQNLWVKFSKLNHFNLYMVVCSSFNIQGAITNQSLTAMQAV